ncbi:hypothetical protein [Streptomyces sp. 8N616]|uniref:hypothetical protein n=1 Tax=Streptomyces sp. 8N616 TaxID=3457414 RepID=UPI003FD46322
MQGDEARPVAAGSGDSLPSSRVRTGPRHAAPRKSLLTKLQIPAGKAIALAAMPTAVFVGMSLTPKLAQADEVPGNPFAPGPCVTRSDEPKETEDKKSPSPSESPEASVSAKPVDEAEDTADDVTDGAKEEADKAEPKPSEPPSAGESPSAGETPSPEPTPTESTNPLDPLGIGEKLGDLLTGDSDEEPTPTASSSSTPSEEPSSEAPEPTPSATTSTPAEEVQKTTEDVQKTTEDAQDTTKDAIKEAADKVGAKVEEVGDKAKDTAKDLTDGVKDEADGATSGKDGKEPFPCPTKDPKALAAADLEPGVPLLPDDPWRLETSKLTLRGLDYHGIVEVKTYSGKVKKVLKFTAKETDIKDLHQLVVGPQGTTAHVEAAPGSTSTIRDGEVTMYTEELKGNLFGLIPVTFSPETPPPLNVPFAVFTDVKVRQAGQFGGTLTVPGLHSYSTK